jgi:hypothetical protein
VYIDGGSGPAPIPADQASQALANLQTATPWLAFGGIPRRSSACSPPVGPCWR